MKTDVVAVVTQVDSIIDEVVVFTDEERAKHYFVDTITDYANDWGSNQEEVDIALENERWEMGNVIFSIEYFSFLNNMDVN